MDTTTTDYDVCVIGAGFAGMYMLKKLRELGLRTHVFERGDDVGGTWYWNRYPGARCDVESLFYCYSFDDELQQEWTWSERYPAQPEILAYCRHVADRYDLRRDISFGTPVESVVYDEVAGLWNLRTGAGQRVRARWVITAVGCLSASQVPRFPGLDDFRGQWFHTGQWPHEPVDFVGQRVAVIGTGSSGIQAIPAIARTARQLTVFQRTPNFSVPAHNGPLDPGTQERVKAEYAKLRAEARVSPGGTIAHPTGKKALDLGEDERRAELDRRWADGGSAFLSAFADTMVDEAANRISADYVRDQIRRIVKDPATAELLCPRDHPIGSKRICVDTGYYETYNRDNVRLVDVRANPIERITEHGVRVGGVDHEVDAIVFATGYDAMTGPLTRLNIRGVGGQSLADSWSEGPRTYLGLAVPGFPNLFTITGPGSPSVLSNMVVSIEQHVEWIAGHLDHLRRNDLRRSEADPEAARQWTEHVDEVARHTLYPQAASWYMGANVPGKPRVFMPYVGGVGAYREICDGVAAEGYKGFQLSR
ncbi:cyclohexanone monooxygenase [Amycolatopsis bartoniae]|uniref:Cyclohexanone monooxygenase n=1 Tax=Amycolatopsis bartoniae TaxID=941986 RepID=A0A8H9IQ90_9PSEU|nr:NAD(P)/FAD-dependent oxidoreductase [Amycolatopsis bartoniae]MBB2939712.1 cyclohexanone monooxygenase [Amycolatopsis bartoniae]TVT06169.1 NAD(P)/FAD-dependent oxidoreductase [Amycolatopsis bartoniae]GHF36327.1 cyclohexanone monooxygenase [Amycolatopsis bartoniae]